MPGSKPIYTSADVPDLIYDCLFVAPESLAARRADWLKVTKVWYRIVDYLKNEDNTDDALSILASRVKVSPDEYEPFLEGTGLPEVHALQVRPEVFPCLVIDGPRAGHVQHGPGLDVRLQPDHGLEQHLLDVGEVAAEGKLGEQAPGTELLVYRLEWPVRPGLHARFPGSGLSFNNLDSPEWRNGCRWV